MAPEQVLHLSGSFIDQRGPTVRRPSAARPSGPAWRVALSSPHYPECI